MFGHAAPQALGQDLSIIMPERFAVGYRRGFDGVVSGGVPKLVGRAVELIGVKADRSEFPVELSLARWGATAEESGFAAIVRDISARKALERDRDHARSFLDTVVANLPAMLFRATNHPSWNGRRCHDSGARRVQRRTTVMMSMRLLDSPARGRMFL